MFKLKFSPNSDSFHQNFKISKYFFPKNKSFDLFLYFSCFLIFDFEKLIQSLIQDILKLFIHVDPLMSQKIISFCCLDFLHDSKNRVFTLLSLSALKQRLKSLNKFLIGLSRGESFLSDLNGLKNSKISNLSQQIVLLNFLRQLFFVRLDTSDKMIRSR